MASNLDLPPHRRIDRQCQLVYNSRIGAGS
jgi:hypothetical protein